MRFSAKHLSLVLGSITAIANPALSKSNNLNILCFGDSLTAGYIDSRQTYHPYTISLGTSLQDAFPKYNISISNEGLPGDKVQSPPGQFLPRMMKLYNEDGHKYNFAIILGGTNDLNWDGQVIPIYQALTKVWNVALDHDTKVLALTITESGNTPEIVNERRSVLNNLILQHEQENFFKLDLSSKIPYFDMPEERRKELWSDGTHFTPSGYDLVGIIIAGRVIDIIEGAQHYSKDQQQDDLEL